MCTSSKGNNNNTLNNYVNIISTFQTINLFSTPRLVIWRKMLVSQSSRYDVSITFITLNLEIEVSFYEADNYIEIIAKYDQYNQ